MQGNKLLYICCGAIFCLLVIYGLSGIYSLGSGQRAVVLRFGEVIREVSTAGMHYHLPKPVEQVWPVYVSEVQTVSVYSENSSREQITGDKNLIMVRAIVGYDIKNLTDYLFNVSDVNRLVQATAQNSFSRELAGLNVDNVMSHGKSLLRFVVKESIQERLDQLAVGVRILSVELTDISPPERVAQAFKAVSDARVKKQRIIQDAEGFANVIIPEGRGEASSVLAKAEADAVEILAEVNGETRAFLDLLEEYKRNPEFTKELQYLQTMQKIYADSKVFIDSNASDSLYFIGQNVGWN